jgi:hypothetical protein
MCTNAPTTHCLPQEQEQEQEAWSFAWIVNGTAVTQPRNLQNEPRKDQMLEVSMLQLFLGVH